MASSDIANILGRTGTVAYITQEVGSSNYWLHVTDFHQVIWGANEPIQPSEYVQNGNVQE
jgi:hypothetical protein